MMKGYARAVGAVSIVNAIASGKGATLAVGLPTSARVTIRERRGAWKVTENGKGTASNLPLAAVNASLAMLGKEPTKYSGSIETSTTAPIGKGLKTSSSSSVAITLAVCDAFDEVRPATHKVLECSVRASLSSGVSVTGAMDDAASCLLGGANFVDNSAGRLMLRTRLGRVLQVLIKIPDGPSRRNSVKASDITRFSEAAASIFNLGIHGATWRAMILNGLLYSSIYGYDASPALIALEAGAIGAGLSGTGPAVAAVFEETDKADALSRIWAEDGSTVLRTATSDGGATIGS